MQPSLNPALRDFWLAPGIRNRVLYGGRASSKTWDAAGVAIYLTSQYRVRFLCTRQFQNKIAESVYTTLKLQAERFGVDSSFKFTDSSIINKNTGSSFVFYGRARNIKEIKGTEGIDIHWAEECELMTADEWREIDATVRKDNSQHWLIFNPRFATDFVYKRFVTNPPPKSLVRHINYNENPFLSQTMRDVIAAAQAEDYDEYSYIYLGQPLSDDARVIIRREWIEAATDAHIALGFAAEGRRRIGFDVADDGADKCANVFAHGSVVEWADEWKAGEDELLQSCSRTYNEAVAREAEIVYDSIGVGAHAGAKFNELNEARGRQLEHVGFNAGGAVVNPDDDYQPGRSNKDMFANIKAQAWWGLADRFRNTYNARRRGQYFAPDQLISISSACPHLEKLKTELSTPFRDFDANGRVKVESKADMKTKRKIASPNIADAFVMCYAPMETQSLGLFGNFLLR